MTNFKIEDFKKYQDMLFLDKVKKRKYKLIDNNYLIHENLNAGKIRCIEVCKNDNYGFTSQLFSLISSMNITNERIVISHELYEKIKSNKETANPLNTYIYAKYQMINESIVHDIKKFCDKLIVIAFLIVEKEVITHLKIKSVGEYFNDSRHFFKSDEEFLHLINDLDNSYKHSFSNNMDPGRIGLYDNCIVNYYSKDGNDIFHPKIFSVRLDDLIGGFNAFFDNVENFIKENVTC